MSLNRIVQNEPIFTINTFKFDMIIDVKMNRYTSRKYAAVSVFPL